MSLASKKRRRRTRDAARARGDVAITRQAVAPPQQAPKVRKFIPQYSPRVIAPTWTTRLRRHGGLYAIAENRGRQVTRIAQSITTMVEHKRKALADAHGWLLEHPLRLLSKQDEDYFWPPQNDDIVDLNMKRALDVFTI